MATGIVTVHLHICPKCGCTFPTLRETLAESGVYGPLCADCWVATQPRIGTGTWNKKGV